jgi:hypothetical protein
MHSRLAGTLIWRAGEIRSCEIQPLPVADWLIVRDEGKANSEVAHGRRNAFIGCLKTAKSSKQDFISSSKRWCHGETILPIFVNRNAPALASRPNQRYNNGVGQGPTGSCPPKARSYARIDGSSD